MNDLTAQFLSDSMHYMELNLPRIRKCLIALPDAATWKRPNGQSNSVGNLVLHLAGNIEQWICTGLGGAVDNRKRDVEFSTEGGLSQMELYDRLEEVVMRATRVMRKLSERDLLREYEVQGFDTSGIGIIIHVTEHFSYHTGQIAFYTKLLTDSDLGFYDDYDLSVTGSGDEPPAS